MVDKFDKFLDNYNNRVIDLNNNIFDFQGFDIEIGKFWCLKFSII